MCQYADQIDHIFFKSSDGFALKFSNNATWISITNTVLVYSQEWTSLLEEHFLLEHDTSFESMDAMIFGKFTRYEEALNTNFEHTMAEEQAYYERLHATMDNSSHHTSTTTSTTTGPTNSSSSSTTSSIDFASIPPPQLVNAAQTFSKPILAIPMFATTDMDRATKARRTYRRAFPNRTNVKFVNTRHYIDRLGMECGSDDKLVLGTCHEPGDILQNSNRNPADMHRCAGPQGGHADLISWDLIEQLYELIGDRG
jgi:hypothetical protein